MGTDSFQKKFRVNETENNVYYIGGYSPISMKDQAMRATLLIRSLKDLISNTPTVKLVIVGAGVSGIVSALAATDAGCRNVVIVDRESTALSLQAKCESRWVDPVQYDWPAPGWSDQCWPHKHSAAHHAGTALPEASSARVTALHFAGMLKDAQYNTGAIQFLTNKVAGSRRQGPNGAGEIELSDASAKSGAVWQEFDVLIYCTGFGSERTSVRATQINAPSPFQGIDFWSNDTFQEENYGFAKPPSNEIVISGNGDGALQDFIRLATGQKSARDVWLELQAGIDFDNRAAISALIHWDFDAERSENLAPGVLESEKLCRRIHFVYEEAVKQAFSNNAQSLLSVFHRFQIDKPRDLSRLALVVPGGYFERCYPLNRLVALFVLCYMEHRHTRSKPRRYFNTAVISVDTASTPGQPPFYVRIAKNIDTKSKLASLTRKVEALVEPPVNNLDIDIIGADLVVIRHGIEFPTIQGRAATFERQLVPIYSQLF